MISILNASGSTVVIRLREIRLVNTQTTSITGIVSQFDFYRFTGHSGGTSLTPAAFDTTDTLDGSVTVRTGGTITGEGQKLFHAEYSSDEWGVGVLDEEGNEHVLQLLNPIYKHDLSSAIKPITLNAGEGFHIKHIINSTAGSFDLYIAFTQEED